jgi:septum formation protein
VVTFRALSPDEMAAYVAGGEGGDKAGAYAVQGGAAAFVERIEGSYTNVVGLPLSEVVVAMRRLGWL